MMSARRARPPSTAPTMAPMGTEDEDEDDGDDEEPGGDDAEPLVAVGPLLMSPLMPGRVSNGTKKQRSTDECTRNELTTHQPQRIP